MSSEAAQQKNIAQLDEMLTKAKQLDPGKKYRGLTAAQWESKVSNFKTIAAQVCAQ